MDLEITIVTETVYNSLRDFERKAVRMGRGLEKQLNYCISNI